MKIKISRNGLLWWMLSGGPIRQLFWIIQSFLTMIGIIAIADDELLSGIALMLTMPATLLASIPLFLLITRVIVPGAQWAASLFFEVTD